MKEKQPGSVPKPGDLPEHPRLFNFCAVLDTNFKACGKKRLISRRDSATISRYT